MEREVSRILADYETGRVSRRQVIQRLALLGAVAGCSSGGAAEASESTFEAAGLNHIALSVPDVARSRDFYMHHLGLRVSRESLPWSVFLDCGPHFVALFRGDRPGLHHYCYSIPDYDQADAARRLRAQGIEPRLSGQRIYFPDADGIEVQLASGALRP